MRIKPAAILLLLLAQSLSADEPRELYHIRVSNSSYGAIEVSLDKGKTYTLVGRVTRPATTTMPGFSASVYAENGKVAATAVHGIRIKAGNVTQEAQAIPQVISIVPREFAHTPKGFGGHIAGVSGIVTNIPTGSAIFRNLSPFVGNPVLLEHAGGLKPLRDGYTPEVEDKLVIVVQLPVRYPSEIVIQNKAGGKVEAVYNDGNEVIATVERAVRGVGRFDATGYTGVGRVNTNHTGVITVSTAPICNGAKDGSSLETRGGFMIQPSRHGRAAGEVSQVMLVAPVVEGKAWLEGAPPLFSGCIGLAWDPGSEENSFAVEVRCGDSPWEKMPPLIGKQDNALASLPTTGKAVTHLRIRFSRYDENWLATQVKAAHEAYIRSVIGNERPVSGRITFALDVSRIRGVRFVGLYLNGECKGITNTPPFAFEIDTSRLPPGEHIAEVRALDQWGVTLKSVTKRFFTVESATETP